MLTESLVLIEREEADPAPGEVQIRTQAASLHSSEVYSGVIFSHDVAGVVERVGEGVTDLRPGDEVWSYLGGPTSPIAYAELVCVPAQWASRKPVNLTFAEAAAVPTIGLSAYDAVFNKARVSPHQAVLVTNGSSPLGSMIIQLSRYCGSHPILATSGSDHSFRELTQRLGLPPQQVISHHGCSFDDLYEQVKSREISAAFDLVGHHRLSQLCYRAIGFGGSVVSLMDQPGKVTDEAAGWLFAKSASLHFEHVGARARFGQPRHWAAYRKVLQALTGMFEEGHLTAPKICDLGEFSLDTLRGAEDLRPRADALGQFVVASRVHYPAQTTAW